MPISAISPTNPPRSVAHFLGIGINEYEHFSPLHNTIKDVKDIIDVLTSKYQFEPEKVKLLFDQEATRRNILLTLDHLVKSLSKEDSLIIYYAGHSHYEKITDRGFWIPVEGMPGETSGFISNGTIRDYLKGLACQHVLLISDGFFSSSPQVR